MGVGGRFPGSGWLWRGLSSRLARLLYLAVLAIVIVPGIALRVDAALFERRVHKLTMALSGLRVGVTTEADALSRLEGFCLDRRPQRKNDCEAAACVTIHTSTSHLAYKVLYAAGTSSHWSHETLYPVLKRWGFGGRGIEAYVNFTTGKVSLVGYRVEISTPYSDYPGEIVVNVRSTNRIARQILSPQADESPDYEVSRGRKWSEFGIGVSFTPNAPSEYVKHAFDLQLDCVWSLMDCRNASQLLPDAEQDRVRIKQTADDRMHSANQCPDRILPHRALDAEDILLVVVTKADPTLIQVEPGTGYRSANFRLLRVLKGKVRRPLHNVQVYSEAWYGPRVHNSAIDVLNAGQKMLLFTGESSNIDEACEAVAGTESAVQTIETALRAIQP